MESRTLYKDGNLEIIGVMHPDTGANPDDQDFDTAEQRAYYLDRHARGSFEFVGMTVRVVLEGKEIGRSDAWGIEHGNMADGITADAWDNTPATYPEPNTVVMGSPLNGVIVDAVEDAQKWLMKIKGGFPVELLRAQQWSDPNR